jgi:C-terminal processing protease CtpA/Prc
VPARRDGQTFIYLCRKKSPARVAGLKENDRILRVNGKPVEEFSIYRLRKTLSHEGEDVKMTVARGDKTFDVKFRQREFRTFLPESANENSMK